MGFAVQLYFDTELEAAMLELRTALTSAGVAPTLERLGDRPHVSLSVLNALDVKRAVPALSEFASSLTAFPVDFAAFGAFPTNQGVVYLSPTPTKSLLLAQHHMHEMLTKLSASVHEHYFPGGWVPHSTIGFEISHREVALALAWLQDNFRPVSGRYSHLGLIEFRPIQELARFPLAGSSIGN